MSTARLGTSEITLGGWDFEGVFWSMQQGGDLWGASPAPREVTGERAVADGNWNATRYHQPRRWDISLVVSSETHDQLHRARTRLFDAVPITPFTIDGWEEGYDVRTMRWRRAQEILWTEQTPTTATVSLALVADDPRIRSGNTKRFTTGAPASAGGLKWPATWPATWGARVTSGQLSLTNEGNAPADILWRIDGPISEPYLIDVETGATLRTSLVLGSGDWLIIDTATHRVLANGDENASRRDRVYGDWFKADPGTTLVQFGGSNPGPGASVTAEWSDTWI